MSSKLNVKPLNEWGFDFKKPVIISGPCSAESEEQLLETAHMKVWKNWHCLD